MECGACVIEKARFALNGRPGFILFLQKYQIELTNAEEIRIINSER